NSPRQLERTVIRIATNSRGSSPAEVQLRIFLEDPTISASRHRLAGTVPAELYFFARFCNGNSVRKVLKKIGGLARNRTGLQGFAVLCVTTPPRGHAAIGIGSIGCARSGVKRQAALQPSPSTPSY